MQTEYILRAMDAALAAGKEILNVYNDPFSDFQIERKADNSPLTLADRKAHEIHYDLFARNRLSGIE